MFLFAVHELGAMFVVGGILGYLLLEPSGASASIARFVVACSVVAAVSSVPAFVAFGAPFRRLQRALDAGTTAEHLSPADVRNALLLPRRVFWFAAALWGSSMLAFPLFADVAAIGDRVVDVYVAGLCIVASGAVVAYYVAYAVVGLRAAPVLLPQGTVDHLPPFRPFKMYAHVMLAVLVLGVTSPIAALVLARSSTSPWAGFYVVGFFLLVGLFQTASLVAIVAGGVGHIEARMKEVQDGRLDVRAQVRALDTFGVVASRFNRMVEGLRQREMLREAFGRYVTKQVADEVLAGRVALGGELRTATVLFSDIRGFTSMSESMTAPEVVAFLNRYLDEMVDCVFAHGGILDKFIGDAVMAVFGVPVSNGGAADDAIAAVRCALEMESRLARMNAERAAQGEPPIDIGVGLHTGELVAGNIGSPKRMEYTVIGDTVNVSSRIEGMTKQAGRRVLMSEATARLVEGTFPVVEVGEVALRGRARPVALYTVGPTVV